MKIGILTFHNAQNYGAVLQAYALRTYIAKIRPNDDVSIIDYENKKILHDYKIFVKRRTSYKRNCLVELLSFICQIFYAVPRIRIRNKFKCFRNEKLKLGARDFSFYDCIIYGSDQIWNTGKNDGIDFAYFGKDYSGKKIAYAVSDGGELSVSDVIKSYIKQYQYISCREKALAEKLRTFYTVSEIQISCDPVFLLGKGEWEKLVHPVKDSNYILVYKIGANDFIDKDAELFGKKHGKKVIEIVYIKSIKRLIIKHHTYKSIISVEDFLSYLYYADIVLTTSFHGTAFSIIFEKTFYAYEILLRSDRITDLLEMCGFQNRYIKKIDFDNKNHNLYYTSDSKKLLNDFICKSKEYLNNVL